MAIPDYIHPLKLILACFGVDPRRALPGENTMMQTISGILQLPNTRVTDFASELGALLSPIGEQLTKSTEVFLKVDSLVDEVATRFQVPMEGLKRDTPEGASKGFDTWIASTLRIDRATFNALFEFSLGRLNTACYPPGTRPHALIELDGLCDALITAAPCAFRAAHTALLTETGAPQTPASIQRQQASVRPLHHLIQAEKHEALDQQYSALVDRLQAWEGCAETTLYAVVKFIWTIRGFPGSLSSEVPGGRKPQKGNVFKLAAEWCDRNSVPFPFRRDLYDIRNAIAHKHYTISGHTVSFNNSDGESFASIELADAAEEIGHDILLASHFGGALAPAEFRYLNRSGAFDAAWASAKAKIPELERLAFDPETLWPLGYRRTRFGHLKARSFRTRKHLES